MKGISLNLVVLRYTDLERAVRFYECLGIRFTRHRHGTGPEHYAAEIGGSVFELYLSTPEGPSTLGVRIGFSVPDLDAAIAVLGEFPEAIASPPRDSPWGRRAVVVDPDGHRIELLQS